MKRPLLLDLFAGHGGAAMGYWRAGFEVFGVDIEPWSFYPFPQVEADAIEYVREHGHEFDAIHASPPCQGFSMIGNSGVYDRADYPDLIGPTVDALRSSGKPWVLENVPGASGAYGLLLCGSMFDGVKFARHRYFAGGGWNFPAMAPMSCNHGVLSSGSYYSNWGKSLAPTWEAAGRVYLDGLGMPWVPAPRESSKKSGRIHGGLIEGIPPAYTEWIGLQLIREISG